MNRLELIQNYINGKTKDEIDAAIQDGRISFDKEKYRMRSSAKTISGYTAEFTLKYKNEMQKIFGCIPQKQAFVKLDLLLSEGYTFREVYEEEFYVSGGQVRNGNGKSKVAVYVFTDSNGDQKELLLADGKFVKGSLAMVQRKSDWIESSSEDVFARQDYVMEIFGTDRQASAFVTTMLESKDDDVFEDYVQDLKEFAMQVMDRVSVLEEHAKIIPWRVLASESGADKIRKLLFDLAGSDARSQEVLKKLLSRSIQEKRYEWKIFSLQKLILSCIKKELNEILMDEDIIEYRDFVNGLGRVPDGYTCNIDAVADMTGMQIEVIRFIMKYGSREDFDTYMCQRFYDPVQKKFYCNQLDACLSDQLYHTLERMDDISVPVSYRFMKTKHGLKFLRENQK